MDQAQQMLHWLPSPCHHYQHKKIGEWFLSLQLSVQQPMTGSWAQGQSIIYYQYTYNWWQQTIFFVCVIVANIIQKITNNAVCVCVCVWVDGWVSGWVLYSFPIVTLSLLSLPCLYCSNHNQLMWCVPCILPSTALPLKCFGNCLPGERQRLFLLPSSEDWLKHSVESREFFNSIIFRL